MTLNRKLQNKTDYELLMMVNEQYRYGKELLTELLVEIDRRGLQNDRITELKAKISDYGQKHFHKVMEKKEEETKSTPKLFTENSLFLFSFIFSTFFASIVMAFNLREVRKQQAILPLVSFGFLYTATVASISQYLDVMGVVAGVVLNGVGAYIILKFFWKPYIGEKKYEKRPLLVPLLIGILLTLPALYFMSQSGMTF